jgi:hypothetical protein
MNATLRTLLLPLFVTALGAAIPSFAQDGPGAPAASAQPAPAPALVRERSFVAKGPVPLYVSTIGDDLGSLRIVRRSHVVSGNIGRVALSVFGTSAQVHNKEDYLGDAVTDSAKPQNLLSPLQSDLPKALDEKITTVLAENEGSGAAARKNPMVITPLGWHLLYHELMAAKEHEEEYVLRFSARVGKRPEGAADTFFRKVQDTVRSCTYVSKPRTLSAWKENDYDAVATLQKQATQACIEQLTPELPALLGIDSGARIKSAKLNCQTEMNLCVAEADTTADPKAAKVECKVEYKQCVSEDVQPLLDSTPLGACKATYASCKTAVKEKARAINPGVKPEKSEYLPCANEFRACVKNVKDAR